MAWQPGKASLTAAVKLKVDPHEKFAKLLHNLVKLSEAV
jgi:hypothetical protein